MRALLALSVLLLASGCVSVPGPPNPRDPWESYNRTVYKFNDAADKAVLKPVAEGYQAITPNFMQTGIANFFENLYDVKTGINNILQGKVVEGLSDFGRFGFNSVVGIFGLWDVATPLGLEKHDEDFGQTLGWWGVPSGPFFMIPLLGPSTARDAPARYVDPQFAFFRGIDEVWVRNTLYALDIVRTRAGLLKAGKILDDAALDPYSFLRDAWMQRRQNLVYDGKPPKDKDDE
jgi:phospholipid-binding lipoprotein MlaA